MFTWPPLYTEFAKALQQFKDRQPELIAILKEIKKTGIPMIRLIDAPQPATAPTLATIDPFTFFACFNRRITEQNRIEILKILKEKFHLNSEIPTDFAGVPIVDNQQSWFFPYRRNRKPDDVESLWKLADLAIERKPEELNPQLFDRCLQIHTVGPGKLTMGIFWMNPKNYLALDEKNRAFFKKASITTKVADHASYLILLRQVREKLGEDYIQISRKAWEGETKNTQYWAGGFRWGDTSKLDEFTRGNFWQIGWKKNDRNPAAKKTWTYFKDIKVGDEFAIKGYGGRNDLKVHYVGEVTDKSNKGVVRLKKLDRPLFHDKGPLGLTGATWFDTLVPIKNKQIIEAVFGGVTVSTPPAAQALPSLNVILEAAANPNRNYALFIDEINRGNVASIFGELITLIEQDKRLKAANELTAILPYSREEFGVPANLYLIGTMNTADRSVEALDTALRRRFTFVEVRPDRELISQPAGLAVDLRRLFDVINDRIEQLLDHDHCIGHAYFMEIKNLSDLRHVFANKIIPLLREYFYGHPAKVGMVLGDRFVSRKAKRIPFAPGWGVDELDEKEVFQFADVLRLTAEDFESIYEQVGTGI